MMNAQLFIVSFLVAATALVNPLIPTDAPSEKNQSFKFYEDYIDKYISRCQTKVTVYENIKFKNIQKTVILAKKKAAFLSENRNQLINDIIDKKIGKKHYLVELYLNKRFDAATQEDDYSASQALAMLGM